MIGYREWRVPARFYYDHIDRDCLPGIVVKRTKQHVTVALDEEAYEDLLSDAEYYASFSGSDFSDNKGVVLSARATLKILSI